MHNQPRISVIVAVYNGAKTLDRCLSSITTQDYPHVELIVIDGGSNDGSQFIIERYRNAIAYWVSETDEGLYDAWNKGLSHASGEWISFLGCDDFFWSRDTLSSLSTSLPDPRDARFVYGQNVLVDADGKTLRTVGREWALEREPFFQGLPQIPHPGMLHHRSVFSAGGFDKSFRIAGDFELLLRNLKPDAPPLFLNHITIAGVQTGGISDALPNRRKSLQEARIALRRHFPDAPLSAWRIAYIRVTTRMLLVRLLGDNRAARLVEKIHQVHRWLAGTWKRRQRNTD